MKIKGLSKLEKNILNMQDKIEKKVKNINWENQSAQYKDEELNTLWVTLDSAINAINDIKRVK